MKKKTADNYFSLSPNNTRMIKVRIENVIKNNDILQESNQKSPEIFRIYSLYDIYKTEDLIEL